MVLSAAAITASFLALAFTPAQKNNAMEEAVVIENAFFGDRCETKYKTEVTFTACNETNTSDSDSEIASEVLAMY